MRSFLSFISCVALVSAVTFQPNEKSDMQPSTQLQDEYLRLLENIEESLYKSDSPDYDLYFDTLADFQSKLNAPVQTTELAKTSTSVDEGVVVDPYLHLLNEIKEDVANNDSPDYFGYMDQLYKFADSMKDEPVTMVATAPLTCPEYEQQIAYVSGLIATCTGRRCRSFTMQMTSLQGAYNMFCLSQTSSASPSNAPSFPAPSCECMGYGNVIVNTLVFEDFDGTSDTEGKLYVGGNANLLAYSVGEKLPVNCDEDVLVVAGALDFESGRVYSGSVVYGAGSNVPVGVKSGLPRGCTAREEAPAFNFAGAKSHYEAESRRRCALPDTGTFMNQNGDIVALYTNAVQEVYTLPCQNLTESSSLSFGGISNSADIVLNLRGTDCLMNTMVESRNASRVLFNFCDATSVTINAISLRGSVLAPFADISGDGGVIEGQVVAKTMRGETQQNAVECKIC
jgi:choice-of-anchor A domain-containing protein